LSASSLAGLPKPHVETIDGPRLAKRAFGWVEAQPAARVAAAAVEVVCLMKSLRVWSLMVGGNMKARRRRSQSQALGHAPFANL